MTVTRGEIVAVLTRYLGAHPGRAADAVLLAQALDREHDLASRETLPLHVTASAAAIDRAGRVLMIRDAAPGRWSLPGGHLESADQGLYGAALRVLEAGTGISWRQAVAPPAQHVIPMDLDVHEVTGEPVHLHADFRFAFPIGDAQIALPAGEAADWREPVGRLAERAAAHLSGSTGSPGSPPAG